MNPYQCLPPRAFWRTAMTGQARKAQQYGVFSFRTGNLYTPTMLRQWLVWALGCSPREIQRL
ncbi:hypothetical protein PUR31_03630 [Pseudomonas mosselii]|uniref:hypothetical protein n=1 Tax=unclassified Pseudomonas TaxID=196821 RepID=UPI0020C3D73B|nr:MULTISPECIES: hypothetical protein [unclassified Pseudomonas]MCP8633080.1 hypothetical protein [Pseudomonas sp. DVZ6]MDD7783181.1 hypothetical protein [Pseudomonas sp. DVZ24]